MKAVILAGGFGTRIGEESDYRPKPMVEINGEPLLWHIMKIYSHYGINDFVICLGYKGSHIKNFFTNYHHNSSSINVNLKDGKIKVFNSKSENWNVTLVETGLHTMTGGRLKKISQYLDNETFCLTYGDGLSDIDISSELEFHREHGSLATVAAVKPPGRFGILTVQDDKSVTSFQEKSDDAVGWINGGFFILEPGIFDYISDDDQAIWENEPLRNLAIDGKLFAFEHRGFWQPCDTLRDKRTLEKLSLSGEAKWMVWKNK